VDLPPGTADIQRTVFTLRKRTTLALLVVTPQLAAHREAHRTLAAALAARRPQPRTQP
jgi:Mrp family chromosome partitioning ATPase